MPFTSALHKCPSQMPFTNAQNGGAEASAEWVFAHMEDPDFNDPLPAALAGSAAPAGGAGGSGGDPVDAEAVGVLAGMGFTAPQAEAALKVLTPPRPLQPRVHAACGIHACRRRCHRGACGCCTGTFTSACTLSLQNAQSGIWTVAAAGRREAGQAGTARMSP